MLKIARSTAKQILEISPLVWKHPSEFWDRFVGIAENTLEKTRRKPDYPFVSMTDTIAGVEGALGTPLSQWLEEPSLAEITDTINTRKSQANAADGITKKHNLDLSLARLIYAVVRALQPEIIVETGVANGISSSFILQALAMNKRGRLLSIDLPPRRASAQMVGQFVPDHLRDRWELHFGTSRRILPHLLKTVGHLDMFIHDSLHTYHNMRWEFDKATEYLTPGSVVIADDIGTNAAFLEWAGRVHPRFYAAVQEADKKSAFGLAVLQKEPGS